MLHYQCLLVLIILTFWSASGVDAQPCPGSTISYVQGDCNAGWWKLGSYCYLPVTTGATFAAARADCLSRSSRLTWVDTRDELCALAPMLQTQFGWGYVYAGGRQVGLSHDFVWVNDDNSDGPPVAVEVFHSWQPNSFTETVTAFERESSGWALYDRPNDETYPYVCQSDPGSGGSGDPHMLIHLPAVDLPLCFDYTAQAGEVIEMVDDSQLGLTVTAELVAKDNSVKTFFKAIHVLTKECVLSAQYNDVTVNGDQLDWETASERTQCGIHTTVNMVDDDSITITTVAGIEVIVDRQVKVTNRGATFTYLNFFLKNQQHLSPTATGLIGQFAHMDAEVVDDSMNTNSTMLVFPGTARKFPVSLRLHHKRHPSTHQRIGCWLVDDVEGFIGDPKNYVL